MSAVPAQFVQPSGIVGKPFAKGSDSRRWPGRLSKAELEFRAALDAEHIPKASALLTNIFEAGMGGDVKAAELFFKVCGLIRKPTDDAAIAETAKALLDGMIAEARSRRQP